MKEHYFFQIDVEFIINLYSDKCSPNGKYLCENGGTSKIDDSGHANCTCTNQHDGLQCQIGMPLLQL